MLICMFCGTQEGRMVTCPVDGQHYCSECYPAHIRIRMGRPQLFPLSLQAQGIQTAARHMHQKYKERLESELKDTEGTPTPAATMSKVYRGGGGSPDEPPEGAGAPNRPRKEAKTTG